MNKNKKCYEIDDCNKCPLQNYENLCNVAMDQTELTIDEVLDKLSKEIKEVQKCQS